MLVELENDPMPYAWGSTQDLALLQNRAPSGGPEAEVWFGDHAEHPARVVRQGRPPQPLDSWIASHGDSAGLRGPLPVLVKLLAAASPLSLQVHPTLDQARNGYAREEAAGVAVDSAVRNYRDRQHKPELIVALRDGFEALAGLRPAIRTAALLEELGVSPGVQALRGSLAEAGEDGSLAAVIAWVLSGDASEIVREVCEALRDRAHALVSEDLRAVARVEQAHRSDPGVVIALMMNRVVLARGQGLFVPARTLHSYIGGLGVEVMAPSDNVLRGGLTSKHVDESELVRTMDARPASACVCAPEVGSDGVRRFSPPGAPFEVWAVESAERLPLPCGAPLMVVASSGRVDIETAIDHAVVSPGRAALITPDEPWAVLSARSGAFVVLAREEDGEERP